MKEIHNKLWKLENIKSTGKNLEWKKLVCNNDSDIYSNLLADYELHYTNFSDEKKIKHSKHKFKDLFLGEYTYDKVWSLKW